jgi:hypothetical protein
MYDENHVTICDDCCPHSDGWHKIENGHGKDDGKYMCKKGCGAIRRSPPSSENDLTELTREALADVLGREPTEQEILRAHASFKRMAVTMYEHISKTERVEKKKTV